MALDRLALNKKRYIPKEEMYVDGEFIGPQKKHNWLFADEEFGLSKSDVVYLEEGHCIALNINDEYVCFLYLER